MTLSKKLGVWVAIIPGVALFPAQTKGGAWTQPEGAGIFISKVEYATASASFDGAGEPAEGEFYKLHAEAYGEYGLIDSVTLVGQVDYDTSWLDTEGEAAMSEGIGRLGAWARVRVWSGQTDVASVQAGVELPGDRSGVNLPALGFEPASFSLRGLFGRGFSDSWGSGFLDVQAGLLLRDEDAPTQAELDLTAGHWFREDFLLMGQLFNTYSLDRRASDPQDYDETKAAISIGWKATEESTFVLGASADLATRNLEPTRSAFLSVWRTF